jgi:hypothetical protein
MWLTFGRNLKKDIHIDLGSDQTSYIIRTQEDIIQLTFEDANAMMAENPYTKKRYRKHYAVTPPLSINTAKEPISLIMEMRSY